MSNNNVINLFGTPRKGASSSPTSSGPTGPEPPSKPGTGGEVFLHSAAILLSLYRVTNQTQKSVELTNLIKRHLQTTAASVTLSVPEHIFQDQVENLGNLTVYTATLSKIQKAV